MELDDRGTGDRAVGSLISWSVSVPLVTYCFNNNAFSMYKAPNTIILYISCKNTAACYMSHFRVFETGNIDNYRGNNIYNKRYSNRYISNQTVAFPPPYLTRETNFPIHLYSPVYERLKIGNKGSYRISSGC